MATTADEIKTDYPLPVYRFVVDFGGEQIAFSEVSGLDIGYDPITYSDGLGKKHMPGKPTDVDVTLKRGMLRQGSQFFDWINTTSLNLIDKKDLTISLTDQTASTPIVTWKVFNAFPTQLTAPTLDGSSNDVAIEELQMRADSVLMEFA